MYHCTLRIRLCLQNREIADTIRCVQPLERFSHIFLEQQDDADVAIRLGDNIVFVDARYVPRLAEMSSRKAEGMRLILVLEDVSLLEQLDATVWDAVDDIRTVPLTPAVVRTRFQRLLNYFRQRREARLTEYFLHETINATNALVWFKDTQGRYLLVNDSFCKTVCKSREEVQGQKLAAIWGIDEDNSDKNICLETDAIAMAEAKTCSFDESVKSPKGMLQFKTWKTPLFDDDGSVMGTVAVAHDVTNLVQLTAEFDLLLDSLPFAVVITDAKDIIVNVNRKFTEFTELRREELLGSRSLQWRKRAREKKLLVVGRDGHLELQVPRGSQKKVLAMVEQDIVDKFGNRVGRILIFRDITHEREFEQRLSRFANTDGLTGLYNRRYFYERVRSGSHHCAEGLLYLDLDHFKSVNDRWGHQEGDHVLVTVANLLKNVCKEAEVARIGGDEFVLYWADKDLEYMEKKANRLAETMAALFKTFPTMQVLAPSMGLVRCTEKLSLDELLRRADIAMYEAKRQGFSYCIYSPEMEDAADANEPRPRTGENR